jgi:nucleotide-binding universal stress UspA family protein
VTEGKTLVVGVDGSPGSRLALAWAADQAVLQGADLVAVNVWEPSLLPPVGSGSVPEGRPPGLAEEASENLVSVIKEELGDEPPVRVQPRVKTGNAAEVLIDESEGAALLVVGTRGRGGFKGLVLGSVSQHVAAYARCPVAVIR